jgi:hypothetical protein
MNSDDKQLVAKTILAQLGGSRFIRMTGSSNFTSDENTLTMKLARNKSGATHLKITLTVMDDYTLTFLACRKFEVKTKVELTGIYADQLEEQFTEVTGLYTRL